MKKGMFKVKVWDGTDILTYDEIIHYQIGDLNGMWDDVMLFLHYYDNNGCEVYQRDILKLEYGDDELNNRPDLQYIVAPENIELLMNSFVKSFIVAGNFHTHGYLLNFDNVVI